MKNIADKIKYIRVHIMKMTQEEFGKQLNVTRNTIKNWENKISKPHIGYMILISSLCGVSIDYLLFDNLDLMLSAKDLNENEYTVLNELIKIFENKNGGINESF